MGFYWRYLVMLLCLVVYTPALFASDSLDSPMQPNLEDLASLQRGLGVYSNYCSGCHQLEYVRYRQIADDLTISTPLFAENVLPKYASIDDQITTAMTKAEARAWFGVSPPDLSLVVSRRSPDWVYRYLQGFYQDKTRPFGVNNRVSPETMMPNVLAHLQGERQLHCDGVADAMNNKHLPSVILTESKCAIVDGIKKGQMSDQEFKQAVYDVTNFLAYTSDPSRSRRESLGLKVLLFIGLFVFVAYLLKREFWRDIA